MLLDPNHRSLLTDTLTPPPGMRFDTGLATTYSLDPAALLTAPIHLAWLASGRDQDLFADPLRMLEALRRTASRFTVFCERGRMQAPTRGSTILYGLIEPMLRECVAPRGGSFHAKVWLLRYVAEDQDKPPTLRLIVQSRNLTFDRSWDVSLALTGEPNGTRTRQRNMPLGRFLDALLSLQVCGKELPPARRDLLASLIEDARQADWDLPKGFDDLQFHPIGLDDRAWLPERSKELAVISPFVRATALQRLVDTTEHASLLLARAEELDALPAGAVQAFDAVRVLADQAESGDSDDKPVGTDSGLHAKVYVLQTGRGGSSTHIIVGSANATDRVMAPGVHQRSFELMVELSGRRQAIGSVSDLCDTDGLGGLLVDYSPAAATSGTDDARNERLLERVRQRIADATWSIACTRACDAWTLTLSVMTRPDLEGLEVRVWPLTVDAGRAVQSPDGFATPLPLGEFATEQVTSLLGFSVQVADQRVTFALEASVVGMPCGRDAAVDRRIICNRDQFARYVRMLLGNLVMPVAPDGSGSGVWSAGEGFAGDREPALFDLLAKAFARDPRQILPVAQLVNRLTSSDAGDVVPEEFREIWQVFEDAMKRADIHVDTP